MTKKPALTPIQRRLRQQLLDVSYQQKLSHLGSTFSSLDILTALYQHKKPDDLVVLSNGHAAFAWYVVLVEYGLLSAEALQTASVHPNVTAMPAVNVSTGSLGQGLPIAVGQALANPKRKVYCVVSDGEANEGSIWESLRLVSRLSLPNLTILINANGWSAYDRVDLRLLWRMLKALALPIIKVDGHHVVSIKQALKGRTQKTRLVWCQTKVDHLPGIKNQQAHYQVLSDEQYHQSLNHWELK